MRHLRFLSVAAVLIASANAATVIDNAALTKDANPDAARFVAYLRGPEASRIFAAAGFDVPAP